jgi:Protein of unknown function (DUF2778)
VGVALACAWMVCARLAGSGADRIADAQPRPQAVAHAYGKLAVALKVYAARLAADTYDPLFDSRHMLGFPSAAFVNNTVPQQDDQPAPPSAHASNRSALPKTQAVSATAPALRVRTASVRDSVRASQIAADTPADKPTIFERLFGKPSPLTLAYAAADDGGLDGGQGGATGRYDRSTAVYDISAHTVYLPDGTALEAHSGRGSLLDDPRHADEKDRGATPPDLYDLQLRDGLFHGVRALRLIPVDGTKVFGRTGLLAHTYMLGPNGDSFGCVSFKDYDAFLKAYLNREITRLAVVARLD